MEPQRYLQGIHYIPDRLILEITGELIIKIPLILKAEMYIIPSFETSAHVGKSFIPEYKLVFHP